MQLFGLITGFVFFRYLKPFYLRFIVALLFVTCVNELVLIPHTKTAGETNLCYNLFSLIDIGTWLFIYYRFFKYRRWKTLVFTGGSVLILLSLADLVANGFNLFHTRSLIAYEVFIIFLSVRYLYGIFTREYADLFSDPIFWIVSACLLYHSILIINFTTITVRDYWKLENTLVIFNILETAANVIYYLIISFSFLLCFYCNRKYSKASSPQ